MSDHSSAPENRANPPSIAKESLARRMLGMVPTLLVLVQKVWPPQPAVDLPVGLAIVALGVLVLVDPSAVPAVVLTA